jgi:hypothetical protein
VRALAVALVLAAAARISADDASVYFPLRVGNWWAYEELDDDGGRLSRETWTVVARTPVDRAGEFHVRSATKRFDVLGRTGGRRWEGDEYLRATPAGLRKRYPARRDAELDVLLLAEPLASGTQWRDAQGECDLAVRDTCTGPVGDVPDCAVVSCRLGHPAATIVTSTYARGVGMVRQEVAVVQFLPALHGAGPVLLPCDSAQGGHSVLRLTAFHVGR